MTHGLEGRCSIQLSYGRTIESPTKQKMVGDAGFEPATPWTQTKCATKLRQSPTSLHCCNGAEYYSRAAIASNLFLQFATDCLLFEPILPQTNLGWR